MKHFSFPPGRTLRFILYGIAFLLFVAQGYSCGSTRTRNAGGAERSLNDGKGAYATGQHRNLFGEAGHMEEEISRKVEGAFRQLFFGDTATQAIYFPAGSNDNGPLAYIADVWHNDIRSEGMSYGMMIAVQLDRKEVFDALWNYAMTYMYEKRPEHPSQGYFHWSLKRNGVPNSETPAPDGEEYFVMALYFASGRWGNGEGIYAYKTWADTILATMRHHPLKKGMTAHGPRTIHSMVHEGYKMIRFVPNVGRGDFSDPSYHLPAFYELWARWGPQNDRAFWAAAADTSRAYFQKATHPQTALAPDYANFDGTPHAEPYNPHAQHFSFDAWRTAMNWSVDWAWWGKDPREQELSNRIQAFFATQGLATYGQQYTLEGRPISTDRSSGLVATNAVASLAATHPLAKDFVEQLWQEPVPQELGERYYSGLLYLMGLLHCSGRFRIYTPR